MTHIIDLYFLDTDHTIAAFLIETSAGPVLIETGPHSTYGHLRQGVEAAGFRLEDIRHVLLTHIHLDHAGSAWALAGNGATVYVHPLGERHLLDPSRLMESARRIYRDQMDRLWGDMQAIAADRLRPVAHGEEIRIGDQTLKAWHTPGHAVHHIAWQFGDTLFTGDVAGVRIDGGIVVPPCPPPDINIEDWQASIRLMRELRPSALYLTHYGRIDAVPAHLDELEDRLLEWARWMRPHFEGGESIEAITPAFEAFVRETLRKNGVNDHQLAQYDYANPPWMSVAGLMRYWRKKLAGQ